MATRQFVTFEVDEDLLSVDIMYIREINREFHIDHIGGSHLITLDIEAILTLNEEAV